MGIDSQDHVDDPVSGDFGECMRRVRGNDDYVAEADRDTGRMLIRNPYPPTLGAALESGNVLALGRRGPAASTLSPDRQSYCFFIIWINSSDVLEIVRFSCLTTNVLRTQ